RGQEPSEVMLDDEDGQEVGIAAGADEIPGKSREQKERDRGRRGQPDGGAPAFGDQGPEENGPAGKNQRCRSFTKNRESQEKSKEQQREPWSARKNGPAVAGGNQTQDDGGAHQSGGKRAGERHVGSACMREGDHADAGRQEQEQPTRALLAINAPSQ